MELEAPPLREDVEDQPANAKLVSVVTDDAGQHGDLLGHNVDRDYYQKESGPYQGSFDSLVLPDITYGREWQNQSVLRSIALPDDLCALFLPRVVDDPVRVDVRMMEPNSLTYQPQSSTYDVHTEPGSEIMYFTVKKDVFHKSAMTMDPALWETQLNQPLMLKMRDASVMRRIVDGAIAAGPHWLGAGMGSEWASDIRQATLSAVLHEVGAASDMHTPRGRGALGKLRAFHLTQRARAFINDSLHSRITVLDVCAELGVSRRTLQDVFQRTLGMNPVAYLRMVRLHRARHDLRHPQSPWVSVGAVAARWGFLHPSQFSVDYQRMFGELPSHTLRKAFKS